MSAIVVRNPFNCMSFYIEKEGHRLDVYPERRGYHLSLNADTNIDCHDLPIETHCLYEPETNRVHYVAGSSLVFYEKNGQELFKGPITQDYYTRDTDIKNLIYLGEHNRENSGANKPAAPDYVQTQMDILGLEEPQRDAVRQIYQKLYSVSFPQKVSERPTVEFVEDLPDIERERLLKRLQEWGREQEEKTTAFLEGREPLPVKPKPQDTVQRKKVIPFRRDFTE